MSTIDEWESEANQWMMRDHNQIAYSKVKRLIDLVRKKDEALNALLKIKDQRWNPEQSLHEYIEESLAFTEQLK